MKVSVDRYMGSEYYIASIPLSILCPPADSTSAKIILQPQPGKIIEIKKRKRRKEGRGGQYFRNLKLENPSHNGLFTGLFTVFHHKNNATRRSTGRTFNLNLT